MFLRKLVLWHNLFPKRFHLGNIKMLASIIKSTSTMVSNTEAAKRLYIRKVTEKNNKRLAWSWLPSLDFLVGLKHRYHNIQKGKSRAECIASLQFTDSWVYWWQKKITHCFVLQEWHPVFTQIPYNLLTDPFPFHVLLSLCLRRWQSQQIGSIAQHIT